ncbi:MAG: winged helix-turn-helix domain-containing protein, partial [Thermomicrobiales bacterium]|nr:winged helix-turn-helix domain-containing protein [Thermomicrobiales bacterium]
GNAGRVMLHGELLSRVWGPEFRDEVRYLRMWISRLRAKLGSDANDPPLISTFPGSGYRFEAPPSELETPAEYDSPTSHANSIRRPARGLTPPTVEE